MTSVIMFVESLRHGIQIEVPSVTITMISDAKKSS